CRLRTRTNTAATMRMRSPRTFPTRSRKHRRARILYGGLVELIVNAMVEVKPGFLEWEWR
ncbi:MAG: hypothetical protein WCC59_10315, partial [Terriglobales bacterium]